MAVVAITILCLLLFNLQRQQMQSQPLPDRQVAELLVDQELPRKLRISEEFSIKLENEEQASSGVGDKEKDGTEINGNGEWKEGNPNFTMDYSSVKGRRPINNMSTKNP